MVVTCDIQFENSPEGIYYAGQVVMGKITLTADKIKEVKAVNLNINGSAKTTFEDTTAAKGNRVNVCSGQQDYINRVTSLLSPDSGDQSVFVATGIHSFSFVFHIPTNCPSSFEGRFGSVRYIVQVSLVRPWKFDQTFTKAFTVLPIKDLNVDNFNLEVSSCDTSCFKWRLNSFR